MKKISELNAIEIARNLKDLNSSNDISSKQDVLPNKNIINSILDGLNKLSHQPEYIILEVKGECVFLKSSINDQSIINYFDLYNKNHLSGNKEFDDFKYQLFFSRLYDEMKKSSPLIADKLYFSFSEVKQE